MGHINENGCSSYTMFEERIPVWLGEGDPPKVKEFFGAPHYRFMNKFYVSNTELDRLSMDEVISLCRARDKYSASIGSPNDKVKAVFRSVTEGLSPRTVVEIGAGSRPLYDGKATSFMYLLLDADFESLSECGGEKAEFSGDSSSVDAADGSIDLILAVFVFQFEVYESQVKEVSRILSKEGVLLANVYRRTQKSRLQLIDVFRRNGLTVRVEADPQNLCRDHEYWIVSKCEAAEERVLKLLTNFIQTA